MLNAALFGAIAAGQSTAQPVAPLPEDAPLPAATATLNATTANFASVYASAAAGNHIVLANGNYGARTFSRTFPANNRLVIRAQNLLGASFSLLTISGSGQIVSGVAVNSTSAGGAVRVSASNIRVTRSRVTGGAHCFNFGPGITDALVDHCETRQSQARMWELADPKDQHRITVARCWCHDLEVGPFTPLNSEGEPWTSLMFAWQTENIFRERDPEIVVRLCYIGPGIAPVEESDYIHHKGSGALYSFNHCVAGEFLSFRFGMRNRMVGCYAPAAPMNVWDDGHWLFGNMLGNVRLPAGISAYYDETKSLITSNQGGFPATTRLRMSGNQCDLVTLGIDLSNGGFCTRTDGPLPDAQPAGVAKPARSWQGVDYAAFPAGDGLSIRAHTGTIATGTGLSACLPSQAVNVSSLPGSAAPASWLSDLLAEYPWISGICPNPTSLTGGPGGSAPWSVAQALTRGDAANPNTGPSRNSPGGLP